ncbi:hypothetical protein [Nocardia wallacei]|uniref:hypothetical protein n=1 Tax=Nocardia wallacei TaxID=480035 RepID=UPI0024588802|nr:hypothetical protein [Nocardia wallacei]
MPTLTVDFRKLLTLTAEGLALTAVVNGTETELLIQGVTLDDIANFAAAEHLR